MADYAVGSGRSLRDAVNALMPMSGMGEYNSMYPPTMFPPNSGSEPAGAPPVSIPRQRPPMPVALPPGGVNLPPTYPGAQQLYQGLQANPAPQMAPGNYAQRLGLIR